MPVVLFYQFGRHQDVGCHAVSLAFVPNTQLATVHGIPFIGDAVADKVAVQDVMSDLMRERETLTTRMVMSVYVDCKTTLGKAFSVSDYHPRDPNAEVR